MAVISAPESVVGIATTRRGGAGYGLHHVLSQTLARAADVGHGAANACMLPHSLEALERRCAGSVGPPEISYDDLLAVATAAAGRAGAVRLRDLGVGERQLGELAQRAAQRVELEETAPRAQASEILAIYTAAW
jgi:alcohol dehydrogenase class IV